MSATVIEGCAIATVDAAGTEHADGHLVIADDRLVAVGAGPAPPAGDGDVVPLCLL
jgi:cytosine/adenosine deaminase-related metal-dependent hydrolase